MHNLGENKDVEMYLFKYGILLQCMSTYLLFVVHIMSTYSFLYELEVPSSTGKHVTLDKNVLSKYQLIKYLVKYFNIHV